MDWKDFPTIKDIEEKVLEKMPLSAFQDWLNNNMISDLYQKSKTEKNSATGTFACENINPEKRKILAIIESKANRLHPTPKVRYR